MTAPTLDREAVIVALAAWALGDDPAPLRALAAWATGDGDLGRLVQALLPELERVPADPLGCADRLQEAGLAWLLRGLIDEMSSRETPPKAKVKVVLGAEDMLDARTQKAWQAIQADNVPPALFRHGGGMARVERDVDDAPSIRAMNGDRLRHHLSARIDWAVLRVLGDAVVETPIDPPSGLIRNLLAAPEPPVPALTRIVEVPTFAGDGTLHDAPGYSPATRCILVSNGLAVPPVPKEPSNEDVVAARRLLVEDLLGDFPFVGDAERAHAAALILVPFVRELVAGPTPLHLVEAPSPGTGKSLLASLIGLVVTGRPLAAMTEGRDEDEWRKRIFAKLRSGPSMILIDNLRRRLDSAALSSALTAWPSWEDRVLGVSEVSTVPVRCTWAATGNNPGLSSEITRRTIRIRLDAKVDRPWLRSGFRHPDIISWASLHRGQLVWAALVLVKNWLALGRLDAPETRTLGMFEDWSRVLGGILHCAGVPGFLGNLEDLYERSDEEGAAWRALVGAWWEKFGDAPVKTKDLFPLTAEIDGLRLGDGTEKSQATRLGIAIRDHRDRTFNLETIAVRVEAAAAHQGVARWRLCKLAG